MIKRFIVYTDRQREEILKYLETRPNKMPAYVRQLRVAAMKVDFEEAAQQLALEYDQALKDLTLMRQLAELEVPIGRKKKGYGDVKATARIRHRGSEDAKAKFDVRNK